LSLEGGALHRRKALHSRTAWLAACYGPGLTVVPLLCLIFFVSGAGALVFETLWFRQASLVFGSSVWASSLVLSSFMAGLALGNGLAARYGEDLRSPLRVYAGVEWLVGGAALGIVYLLPDLVPVLAPVLQPFLDVPWLLNPLRFGLSFVLLLVPATAMGATLPLLVRTLSARDPNFGSVLGRLYGWNTLGAVTGAMVGELWWIGAFGLRGAAWAGASVYLIAGGAAFLLAVRGGDAAIAERQASGAPDWRGATPFLAAAFLSGAILLALEVVWFRFLALFVYGTSVAFAAMLASVLAGIALGGLAASAWLRRRPGATAALPILALASGAAALAIYAGFDHISDALLGHLVGEREALIVWLPLHILVLTVPLVFPTSFLSGAIFTLLGQAARERLGGDARSAGTLTLANTVGGAFGSMLGGFVLLPGLGVEGALVALAFAYTGVAWLARSAEAASRLRVPLLGAGAALVLCVAFFPFGKLAGTYILNPARPFLGKGAHVTALHEGVNETLVYLQRDFLTRPFFHRMLTNGFSMASNSTVARRYMKLFAYWPLAVHHELRSALLISYGMGSTASALTDIESLERIDVVDISRDALAMSELLFQEPVEIPLRDPRVHVHVEDGRFFLQTTERRFDLITGEPPPPKNAGVVSLYTREYFELVHDRLTEGGLATYWLPVHLLDRDDALAITRAFCDAFADCTLWNGNATDWMLVGSRGGLRAASEEHFRRAWADPRTRLELADIGIELPEQLGALFLGDASDLAEWTKGTEALVDDFPHRIRPLANDPEQDGAFYMELTETNGARMRFERSEWVARVWPTALREATLPWFEIQAILNLVLDERGPRLLTERADEEDLALLLRETELEVLPLWLMSLVRDQVEIARAVRQRDAPHVLRVLGTDSLARRSYEESARLLGSALERDDGLLQAARLRLIALSLAGRPDEADELAHWIVTKFPGQAEARDYWERMERAFGVSAPHP
jgi:spermidine synthase